MIKSAARMALTIILVFSLCISCGELDTVLVSSGTYRVQATVNGRSLEACSLVRANDHIRPYFATPVANDPDMTGLSVFIQTPAGVITGKKIRYALQDTEASSSATGSEAWDQPYLATNEDNTNETQSGSAIGSEDSSGIQGNAFTNSGSGASGGTQGGMVADSGASSETQSGLAADSGISGAAQSDSVAGLGISNETQTGTAADSGASSEIQGSPAAGSGNINGTQDGLAADSETSGGMQNDSAADLENSGGIPGFPVVDSETSGTQGGSFAGSETSGGMQSSPVTGATSGVQNDSGISSGTQGSSATATASGNSNSGTQSSSATGWGTSSGTQSGSDAGLGTSSGTQGGPIEEVVVRVKSLDQDIPYFTLPEDMAIGQYTMVFQVLGGKETLYRTETRFFYLGRAHFDLRDIQLYLPSVSSGSRLILPGQTVMLDAQLEFDSRLDPYIVWYRGRTIISEGRFTEGAGNILWKASEQTGFHSLRAEVFPVRLRQGFAGLSREISLPVSAKAAAAGYFFGNAPAYTPLHVPAMEAAVPAQGSPKTFRAAAQSFLPVNAAVPESHTGAVEAPPVEPPVLLHWYQLGGNLRDSKTAVSAEWALIPVNEKPPCWAAAGNSYGLSAGPDNAYLLPPITFFPKTADSGGGRFLLHYKPLADGGIFSAVFPLRATPARNAGLYLFKEGDSLVLRLSAPGVSDVEIPVSLESAGSRSYITLGIEFFIRPYRLEARLVLGGRTELQSDAASIRLDNPLKGEAHLRLGGSVITNVKHVQPAAAKAAPILAEYATVQKTANAASWAISTESSLKPAVEAIPLIKETEQALIDNEKAEPGFTGQTIEKPEKTATAAAAEITIQPDAPPVEEKKIVQMTAIWDEFAVLYSAVPLIAEEQFVEETGLFGEDGGEAAEGRQADIITIKAQPAALQTQRPTVEPKKVEQREAARPIGNTGPGAESDRKKPAEEQETAEQGNTAPASIPETVFGTDSAEIIPATPETDDVVKEQNAEGFSNL